LHAAVLDSKHNPIGPVAMARTFATDGIAQPSVVETWLPVARFVKLYKLPSSGVIESRHR
jgi:hypothetical protein